MQRVRLLLGDITSQAVDAIVNAANEKLLGGGGVDGAIHRTAGPQLLDACRRIPEVTPGVRCPTGQARVTPGFGLPARLVIHTVGPVWQDGQHGEAELLAQCYRNALTLAVQHRAGTVAFPAISCGVFGYPAAQAAQIAVREIERFLSTDTSMEEIRLIAFDNSMHAAYQGVISRHL